MFEYAMFTQQDKNMNYFYSNVVEWSEKSALSEW
jgi:hypothetical protein